MKAFDKRSQGYLVDDDADNQVRPSVIPISNVLRRGVFKLLTQPPEGSSEQALFDATHRDGGTTFGTNYHWFPLCECVN